MGLRRRDTRVSSQTSSSKPPSKLLEMLSEFTADENRGGKAQKGKEAASGSSSSFRGAGNTLGSEDDPAPESSGPAVQGVSSSMMDNLLGAIMGGRQAPPPPEEEEEVQTRSLIFWQDGFSIEDGPLYRYDEPGNKDLLEAIQGGRAPPSLFNVKFNQPLQIEVSQRTNEPYKAPPKITRPFEGSGNRLGSAAPQVSSGASTPAAGASGSSGATAEPSAFELDASKPTTSIQLRLGDGTK
jgi:UBX domain-containing protein 1